MFYVLVFPAKPKPIVCPSPTATCIDIPFGVSFDSSKNFVLSNVTIAAGTFFQLKKQDETPHTPPPPPPPPRATQFDSGEIDSGKNFFLQPTTPGLYTYHCNFHPIC